MIQDDMRTKSKSSYKKRRNITRAKGNGNTRDVKIHHMSIRSDNNAERDKDALKCIQSIRKLIKHLSTEDKTLYDTMSLYKTFTRQETILLHTMLLRAKRYV